MKDFSLGQAWISRVTEAEADDDYSVASHRSPVPDAAQFKAVLSELSLTETAREMARRRWILTKGAKDKATERGEAIFDFLFARPSHQPALALFKGRRLTAPRTIREDIATMAWVTHVVDCASAQPANTKFYLSHLSDDFARSLARLSVLEDGPKQALAAVRDIGIHVIVESGLPGMSVDGASLHTSAAGPVVALTLRYDRIDNFWFTLFHELGHLALHLSEPSDEVFVDSLEDTIDDEQEAEAEANAFAKDALVPRDIWLRSDAYRLGTRSSALNLANNIGVHPAIIAGRIRFEQRNFRILNDLVADGGVRDTLLAGV